eukprot:scaffold317133_cov22-Tisochrysis_lutea.AAC.1
MAELCCDTMPSSTMPSSTCACTHQTQKCAMVTFSACAVCAVQQAPGVQMALVGQPDNTSNSASAAASVHEDTAAEMEHPLSDGAGREGDIRHSRHSSVESSHFQIGMEGVSSSRRGSAVLPSSLPTAAGAGPGGALERHG